MDKPTPQPPLKRANFTPGEVVTSNMFISEQNYHIRLREYWNKALNGWGIIEDSFLLCLNHDSTMLTATPGAAIAKSGDAVSSYDHLTYALHHCEKHQLGIVYVKKSEKDQDRVDSVTGEGIVTTTKLYASELFVDWKASEKGLDEEVDTISVSGGVVLGLIRKEIGFWRITSEYRQQGPIESPGSKDLVRISNAVWLSGRANESAIDRLTSPIAWASFLIPLMMLLGMFIWWKYHDVHPKVPFRILIDQKGDIQGPIAGATYINSNPQAKMIDSGVSKDLKAKVLEVVIVDATGNPVGGVYVDYVINKNPIDQDTHGAVFLRPEEVGNYKLSVASYFPQHIVVRTDSSGRAFPPGIRYETASTNIANIEISVIGDSNKPISISRSPVQPEVEKVSFFGHFLQTKPGANPPVVEPKVSTVAPSKLNVHDVIRVNPLFNEVRIHAQTLSADGRPASLTEDKTKKDLYCILSRLEENGSGITIIDGQNYSVSKPYPAFELSKYENNTIEWRLKSPELDLGATKPVIYVLQIYKRKKEADLPYKDEDIMSSLVFKVFNNAVR